MADGRFAGHPHKCLLANLESLEAHIFCTLSMGCKGDVKAMPTCVMQASLLLGLGAEKKLLSSGDLYLNRELQEWKLGEPNAHDLAAQVAFGSMQTVYDNGFYL